MFFFKKKKIFSSFKYYLLLFSKETICLHVNIGVFSYKLN